MKNVIDPEDFRYTVGLYFSYAESENLTTVDCIRFDTPHGQSMWLYGDSTVEGFNTLPASLQKKIRPILKQNHIRIVE